MKTSVIATLCAIVVLAPHTRLSAGEEEASPAIRLLEKMEFQKTAIESAAGMFEPMMKHFGEAGLPPEALQDIRVATQKFMNDIFSDPVMFKGIAKIYEDNFTAAELEELIQLYDSPLGRKLIAAQPAISQATAQLTMKATAENQAVFQQEIMKIMEKHQNAGGEE
jgi:hypothetical protein